MASTLRVCHVNVHSLRAESRLFDLELMTANHQVDVLCVSETWLRPCHPNSSISLPGFQLPVRFDRAHGRGGGVAVYVRSGLAATPVLCPPSSVFECVSVAVHVARRSSVTVIAAYRPPASDPDSFVDYLDSVLNNLTKAAARKVCLVGDFNAKHNAWLDGQGTDAPGLKMFAFAATNGLSQTVSEPTYSTVSGHDVLLDLMFTNQPGLVQSCRVLPPVSDHCPTVLAIQARHVKNPSRPSKKYKCWNYAHADYDCLRQAFHDVDWSDLERCSDPTEAVSVWHELTFPVLQAFVPMTSVCVRPFSKPWYSSYLHQLARSRDRLFRRSRCHPVNDRTMAAYRKVRNLYVKELRAAERRYYWGLSQRLSADNLKSNSHRWWSTLKKACGWSVRANIPPLVQDNQIHVEEKDKADLLNAFFSRQCSAPSKPCSFDRPAFVGEKFAFSEITIAEVRKALHTLNVGKASGLDQISARLLQECANELVWPLTRLFNLSLATESYPTQWKEALVVPLYKNKGDKSAPSSYRPISILSCASKIFGRLLKKQILSFCLDHDVIPDCQFGFMPGRSTVWQLLMTIESWQEALDAGHVVHSLFLDVAKAFDRVDHALLLSKLQSIGFGDQAVNWVSNYLKGRAIRTVVGNSMSELKSISSGVPQGSVLGPLLFIIFFSDLPAAVQSTTSMYADDTLLYDTHCQHSSQASTTGSDSAMSGSNVRSCVCTVAADTEALSKWAEDTNSVFNASKSVSMVITCSRKRTVGELTLAGDVIPCSETTKHLGVVLTSNLSWSSHIDHLLQKVAPKVSLLKWMAYRLHLPRLVIDRCYIQMVRPILEYASAVWVNCRKQDSLMLEKVQLQVAHAARHGCKALSKMETLAQLGWPTLAWRRRLHCLLLLWKLKNHLGPPQLERMLPATAEQRAPQYALRKSQNLAFPVCSTLSHNKSFLPAAVALFNNLPASIQSSSSLHSFHHAVSYHFYHDRFSFGLA